MENATLNKGIDRDKAVKIAHIVYAVLIIGLAIAVGVLFIVSCVDIYNSQDVSPFTTAAIESHFKAIAAPVIAFPCLVVVGFVLHFVFPLSAKDAKVENDKAYATLSERVDVAKLQSAEQKAVLNERYLRLGTSIGSVAIWLAALVIILVFALNPLNYSKADVNGSVKDLALIVFPSAIVAMGMSFVASLSNKLSKKRELTLLKSAIKQNKEIMSGATAFYSANVLDKAVQLVNQLKALLSKYEDITVWVVRAVVFVVAVVLLVLGILNGGMADVLGKAIRICTECIGLG
ncbi:MAG: hypothetical protein IJ033_04770 [Clostridia bacterium]|nr:hypothetical protein [Clostridia bacterium]